METSSNIKETDIRESPISVEVQSMKESAEKPKRSKTKLLVLILFFFVLILLSILVYSFIIKRQISQDTQEKEKNEEQTLDCNSDIDCLIEASKDCTPAKMLYSVTTKIFGVTQNTSSYFEIKGLESNKCIFYLRTENIDLEFPEDTSEDIIREQQMLYDELEGRDGICKFLKDDLTKLLDNWKVGNFSSEDFSSAECEGEYFGNK